MAPPATPDVLIGGPSPHPAAVAAALLDFLKSGNVKAALAAVNAGDAAAQMAEAAGASDAEIAARARAAAAARPLTRDEAIALVQQAYRDGTSGLLGGKADELQKNDTVTVDGHVWTAQDINDPSTNPLLPNGYRSVLFTSDDGRAALILQGTNIFSGPDWFTNLAQGAGFVPDQYGQAAADTERYRQTYPNLVVGGHSLGGGLANYAAGMTGVNSTVLNPAGLGAGSRQNIAGTGLVNRPPSQVHNMDNDVLTQYVNPLTGQESGDIHDYKTPEGMDPFTAHQTNPEGGIGATVGDHPIASYPRPEPLPPVA
jgi:hypothetical protein